MQSEALQQRWEQLRVRFEERREARQAAQEAAQEVRAAYTTAARRHAAEHAAAAAAAAAESRAAEASRDAGGRFSSGGGAPNGGPQYPLQPPNAAQAPSRRPNPQQQRSQAQPGSMPQGGGSRRARGGSVTASQAALAAFEQRPVGRRRGGVTPVSLAVSLATFMVSRALVGTACFVAGVAYADALQGDRGQRQRALRSLHRTTLRLMHRFHARGAPLLHALTQRCTLWWAQLQQWVAGVAAGAIPVITALGTSVRASLAAPPSSDAPTRKSKGRGRHHVDVYAEREEEEEEETAEDDGLDGSSPDDGHQLHGMPVRRAPHVTGGLLPSADDVILRNSYGDLTGTLSPRSVEDAPVAPPSRGASSLGPGPQSPGLAARAGSGLQDGNDFADGGDQPDLATQAEALSRAVRAAAARQAALDAAQTQLMLREMHSPGASAHGPPAVPVQGGASPLSAETTSSLRAAMQNDAARAATDAALPRQTSAAASSAGEYRLSTPGLDADEEVFAREAVAQKQRADAQAAVLAARARLAEVVAMTQRSASTMES